MSIENGEWIMRGLDWYDPARIQSWDELIEWIDEIGFLPLFNYEVAGFSVEENPETAGRLRQGRGKELRGYRHRPADGRLSAHPGLPATDQQEGYPLWLAHLRLYHARGSVGV